MALVASLLLNGFLIGLITTNMLWPHHGGLTGERFSRFELRRFDDNLPKDAVKRIAAAVKPLAADVDARLAKLRAIRAEILRLAAQPEPDRAAIGEKLVELRTESAAMQELVQRATYDALIGLPAEQRAHLADAGS